ncbi:MAG: TlpA family protein disulfide reductase [Oscillospiraceae bacterium]|nr:TlpA family protein disulfide reductase [Oscillospiraceae bacterium]
MSRMIKKLAWGLALVLLAVVLVIANLPEKKAAVSGAQVGECLPDFSVTSVDGESFTLSDQRGKVVVINLWATWCTPCVKELPNFDRLQAERSDVAVLALHAPPVTSDVKAYLDSFDYKIPFAVDEDGKLCELLGASTVLPQTIIVDADGIVTYNRVGALSYESLCELVDTARH